MCLNFADDEHSLAYGEVVSCFRRLSEDIILNPYTTHYDCRCDDGYSRCFWYTLPKNMIINQKTTANFRFKDNSEARPYLGYAPKLTNKIDLIALTNTDIKV